MIKGKKILLGVTGSIAAYKSIYLVRLLVKAGAEVKVIVTPAAKDFVSTLTLSTLSRNPVMVDLFDEESWSNHVMLGRWADVMIIAPLSCNTLAKMATGQCDNLLLATYLSATCPVVVAPAMDEDMWNHPATKENLRKLESFGNNIIPVEKGDLASGLYGEGRMAEPEQILAYISSNFFLTRPLAGKKAVITAGPTYEPIDPVRFIGNNSSGKMGIAIAKELEQRGAEVTLIIGPTQIDISENGISLVKVKTADEMYTAVTDRFAESDITIMAAAVADYTPVAPAPEKIKKQAEHLTVELVRTKDILKSLGEKKSKGQILVGFALETTNEKQYAMDKLQKKNADMIVLNSLNDTGAGFGYDTNKITIFEKGGQEFNFATKSKKAVAKDIIDTIIRLYYA
ncbi:MAG: bifunctional phosphopantothenoylcysteine decarboxylase/phosphopantothenate--cysteine ligase CoaBC [Chitinophagaceae bacterium]|jgi:phosphopantothenoylcysteine decarboxylase/phosphopantothenate--cysteine ligase|nr:bifunctional phosphopantothenoylcysteine decarboxylase/phosphopantothenate--cysteine ligase CoaBC [Chitinophagaceae bacterium]MBK7680699.1 bifunctional phosphopantothenoylcysteine decarboxylase/phosphopantothenate--cysteine ligase CoaBC [Chitinophagaceae bacterium]MBK8300498.1 bifunctional phosphopantothenoylcysteine decarboxylase/phosphopantothenate--cysteine ligase CoaBC [Chitinophagaceae bacterium]MBK9465005.1 bifunctional phosphopantothenoylcysteine decarboxylase/phosphopantothenate--cyst